MPYMYILKCVDDSYYTGSTWNMEKRLAEQAGFRRKAYGQAVACGIGLLRVFDRVEDAFRRESWEGLEQEEERSVDHWRFQCSASIGGMPNETHWLRDVDPFPERSRRNMTVARLIGFGSLRLRSGERANGSSFALKKLAHPVA
ncbi:MAG: hypothetical protein R3E89_00290 [Thiolinea sp.]